MAYLSRIVRPSASRWCGAASVALAALLLPRSARPQQPSAGAIAAVVEDSSGLGIAGAELSVAGSAVHGFTDDRGRVRLAPIQPGVAALTVRRLGFQPVTQRVTVAAGPPTPARVELVAVAQRMAPVLVRGAARARDEPLAGFYARRQRGIGHFFTRADIEHADPLRLTDLFRRIPGMRIGSTRVLPAAVRMRGATNCPPLVWEDGMPAAAAEVDLDAIPPGAVEAMEVYSGLAEAPMQFMPPVNVKACGVIVIWSRRGGPVENLPRDTVSAAQIADLVAKGTVYSADQVDSPAHADSSHAARPDYPVELLLQRTDGSVMAEFVVDTAGRVEMGTFHAVTASDAAFTSAVRRALAAALFVPAVRGGRRVRQVVHQTFTFVVHAEPSSRASSR